MEEIMKGAAGAARRLPLWFWAGCVLGLAWNAYGVYQFVGSFSQTEGSLMAAGMTAEAARVYLALPGWISVAFAVGVFGGLAGCVLLLLRRTAALPVFAVSLAGYAALFGGDVAYGVFEDNPGQFTVLVFVVVVAAALMALAFAAANRGDLTT